MKLSLKILTLVAVFLNSIYLVDLQGTPEVRCHSDGQGICIDCFTKGTCALQSDGTYLLADITPCPTDQVAYCDDSLYPDGPYGQCTPLPASITACGCSSSSSCVKDPNDPRVILHCDPPTTDPPCPGPDFVDLSTCRCMCRPVGACYFADDPNDECANYFVCTSTGLTPITCVAPTCYDEAACGCIERLETTTEPSTTTVSCQFVDDPNDECGSFFSYDGSKLIPNNCNGTECYDEASCRCMDKECPFVDNPNDDCGSYFIRDETTFTPVNCVGTLCYDEASCGCTDKTKPPIATTPTPPDCSLVDDPNDDCGSYFSYDGSKLIPKNCPGTLCYDGASCGCIVLATTTAAPPPECLFLDDPKDDCGSYFIVDGTTLTPAHCTGTLCYDEASCGCIDRTTTTSTTTTTTTTALTCTSGCPYVDDPNDSCAKFYICDGGTLIAHVCPGQLCFNQGSCECL